MKAKARLPLRSILRDGFDERDVTRIWRRIAGRRSQRVPRWWLRRWLLAGALTVSATALWLAVTGSATRSSGPLRLASGGVPVTLVAKQAIERLALADGSAIVARPHTTMDVLANDAGLFLTALRQGSVRIAVHPGGPRRWVVECGPVSIEVVGTEFEVERGARGVVVSVARGVVVVRGTQVPDHVQRLLAGDRLVVPTIPASVQTNVAVPSATGPAAAETPIEAAVEAPIVTPAPHRAAGRVPIPVGVASPGPTDAEVLITRADAARRSGDMALARRLLGQAIERSQREPAGAVAALTLARLAMTDDPEDAARVLDSALRAGMPRGLEEDARTRLVEARARSGDTEGARQAAREYRRRFPEGARLGEVQRWAAE